MAVPPSVEALRRVGLAAGLDAVGVASVEPFEGTRRILEQRRADGLHGGMDFTYRNPRRSTEPAALLRNAAALVVGARSYLATEPDHAEPRSPEGDQPLGRVARYAWDDHYQSLREGLGAIANVLRDGGFRAALFVDQNALVDREAAYRAGLGFYGKNTNLLIEGRGSWFVLGSLVTDAPLAPTAEAPADGCGPCRRCLDGCPTGALVAPGVLDARRCLAWLVQAPGTFPREFRVALGDRIYGCDTCQEVCPPNRRTVGVPVAAPTSMRRPSQPWVPLLELLAASDEEVVERWGRWYLHDRDPRYLRRNALIALGNVGSPSDAGVRGAIVAAARHRDPLLRAHAVWAAWRLGFADVVAAAGADPDPTVRAEAAAAEVTATDVAVADAVVRAEVPGIDVVVPRR